MRCGALEAAQRLRQRRARRRGELARARARTCSSPAPYAALSRTARNFTILVALDPRRAAPVRSILFNTRICGTSLGADLGQHLVHLARSAPRDPGWPASTTCSSRSACTVSSSVARKAATSVCGRWRMKPTVSDSTTGCRQRREAAGASWCPASRTAGRPRRHRARVSALNSVDLPALV